MFRFVLGPSLVGLNSFITRYYKRSAVCYAYLSDVADPSLDLAVDLNLIHTAYQNPVLRSQLSESRWFTRGWTLQELIAPRRLKFFTRYWKYIGSKLELRQILTDITKIPQETLEYGDAFGESVSRRMSWAAKRQTTRIEDRAYSLLGIFNINMPLLYGEGEQAFQRLQEEIVRMTDDHTVFAWRAEQSTFATWRSLFARSPDEFSHSADFVPASSLSTASSMESHAITNRGLQINLALSKRKRVEKGWRSGTEFSATLRCRRSAELNSGPVIVFIKKVFANEYVRVDADQFGEAPKRGFFDAVEPTQNPFRSPIIVRHKLDFAPWKSFQKCFRIRGMWIKNSSPYASLLEVSPQDQWDDSTSRFVFNEESLRAGKLQIVTCTFCMLDSPPSDPSVILELHYNPQEEYRGICCFYKHKKGTAGIEIESLVRMMDGEAFLAIGLKVSSMPQVVSGS